MGPVSEFLRVFVLTFGLWPMAYGLPTPLTGIVRDPNGAPLPGVRVVLHQKAGEQSGVTDVSGAYSFVDVTFPADVDLSLNGFVPIRRTVDESPADFTMSVRPIIEPVVVTADHPPVWREPTGATVLSSADASTSTVVTGATAALASVTLSTSAADAANRKA